MRQVLKMKTPSSQKFYLMGDKSHIENRRNMFYSTLSTHFYRFNAVFYRDLLADSCEMSSID